MPIYTYRRQDGTTFDLRQKFTDDALTVDPATGQSVVRVVHAAGVIFKGSGFYINDSKSKSASTLSNGSSKNGDKPAEGRADGESKAESKGDGKAENKPADAAPAASKSETKPTTAGAAAD